MKYLIVLLCGVLMSLTFSIDAEAQLLNRLKKKAQQAAEDKAEQKITERVERASEEMVERSWNSVFGEMSQDSTSGLRLPFTMNSNVTTEDEYHFDTITTMEIKTTGKNGESDPSVIMDMHFNENEMYTGTKFKSEEMSKEDGDLFIIYDFKNSAMLMLMSNNKDQFSFAYDWKEALEHTEQDIDEQEETDWDEVDEWQGYTKIGTKTILGYNCDGYRSETENENIEVWVSRDADFGMNNLFSANANAKQLKGKIPENYPHGMLMEMNTKDLKSGDITTMKVTDIKKDTRVNYVMSDYPTMSLGSMGEQN
ncbi:DUF4412 domain-containing protein [Aliifodinibius salicampi]|uniref:DUF4412 domain-containing protein n=1 Tax=Fodinibius salicampi TaxID=1920655 RepID=A0ABT3Q2I6_9BACT|nr:DUF4412 domain-containing protein [Fodinibius salicampi]MCW9714314.1 DUF4412 domain-containing protein [Fodinibius salicampi]